VVAQVLEYGAWAVRLTATDLASIYSDYVTRHRAERPHESLDAAFCKRFALSEMPSELNGAHELVIVASQFDEASERIVEYLAETHDVSINAIFFRVFRDGDREYLTRAWLRDPTTDAAPEGAASSDWNGEYYVSFGGNRNWDEARRYGFISAGGGIFYSRSLQMLSPRDRVWVNLPSIGYVGVGRVTEKAAHFDDAYVTTVDGLKVPIKSIEGLMLAQKAHVHARDETGEYVVAVEWIKSVPAAQAIKERGLFGNQNTVARPRTQKWWHTVRVLKERFGVV
jgi:hypothetical protein